jgi:hypothetical protein
MLSTAIIINSIFLFLHPLLVPNGTTAAWGMGNDQTCSMVGFFLVFGSLMVAMYHNSLALYFYFSIQPTRKDDNDDDNNNDNDNNNKTMRQPEDVVGWPEIAINLSCWIVPAIIAGVGAGLQSYNFYPKIDMCVLYEECDDNINNDNCIPMELDNDNVVGRYGTTDTMIIRTLYQWLLVANALLSILVMGKIQCQTRRAMSTSRIAAEQMENDELDLDGADEQQQIVQKLAAVSTQCVLYTLSYLFSYVWFIALIFIPANNINLLYAFQIFTVALYPLIGVFNCIIYIRPRVQMLQIMYPQDPFVVVVRVAMSKAGDPGEIEMIREVSLYYADFRLPTVFIYLFWFIFKQYFYDHYVVHDLIYRKFMGQNIQDRRAVLNRMMACQEILPFLASYTLIQMKNHYRSSH